jgi:hypothetical protein
MTHLRVDLGDAYKWRGATASAQVFDNFSGISHKRGGANGFWKSWYHVRGRREKKGGETRIRLIFLSKAALMRTAASTYLCMGTGIEDSFVCSGG